MKETSFINQNKKKWAKFEQMSKQAKNDPDEMSRLFVEITDDLAYARTHYSKRSVRVYLNSLAQQIFHSIYKKKREPLSRLWHFWTTDLPLEMYRSRKALLAAFLVLAIGMLIGIVSTIDDPDFLGAVIGYDYVDVTEDNIRNGKPMDIYGSGTEMDSFIGIAMNNLRVALLTFVLGLFFSIGSGIFLFFNGIMVGAFQWFFKVRGLLMTSFLTIWIHGAFEIPAIVLAGAAGITMGNGLVFPKTLTRLQSLSISAKRGIKIMIGIIPIIIIAAFIEGYATRHTVIQIAGGSAQSEWPDWIKWVIIMGSFGFMVLYFVIYPFMVARKTNFKEKIIEHPVYIPRKELTFFKIRDFGELFTDAVLLFSKKIGENLKVLLITVPLFTIGTIYFYNNDIYGNAELDWFQNMEMAFSMDGNNFSILYFSILVITMSLSIAYNFYAIYNTANVNIPLKDKRTFFIKAFVKTLPVSLFLLFFFRTLPLGITLLSVFIAPFIIMPLTHGILENTGFFKGVQKGLYFAKKSWGNTLGISSAFLLLIFLIVFLPFLLEVGNPIELILGMVLDWFLLPLADEYFLVKNCIWAVFYFSFFSVIINIFFTSYSITYYSIKEQEEATALKKQVETFGTKSKTYESEDEGEF